MIDITSAIYKLYSNVVRTVSNIAYDIEGNEVSYDLELVTAQASKDNCKSQAKVLLAQTDWSVLPDVGLANSADFVTYRAIVRGLVKDPVTDPVWEVEPKAVWN
jgi:hypothetical protein